VNRQMRRKTCLFGGSLEEELKSTCGEFPPTFSNKEIVLRARRFFSPSLPRNEITKVPAQLLGEGDSSWFSALAISCNQLRFRSRKCEILNSYLRDFGDSEAS